MMKWKHVQPCQNTADQSSQLLESIHTSALKLCLNVKNLLFQGPVLKEYEEFELGRLLVVWANWSLSL